MAKSSTRKPLGSTENGQKTLVDSTTDDATLDHCSRLESDSEDDFESFMLTNEGDDVATTPVAVSQPGQVSDLVNIDWILNDWIQHEQRALEFAPLTKLQLQAIRLLTILRNSKASLGTYDEVVHWHFRANGAVHMHETASSRHFFSRSKLFSFLKARHNGDVGCGIANKMIPPSRKSRVRMVTNNTAKVTQSLLTRPENKGKHYICYDHDPFKQPPKDLDCISDADTGKCHGETCNELITDPATQVLCEFQIAADGAHLGQFSCCELQQPECKLHLGVCHEKHERRTTTGER